MSSFERETCNPLASIGDLLLLRTIRKPRTTAR